MRALAIPFGISVMLDGASIVSCLAALTWFAAELVAAPFCGFVASSSTFREAIACNCVAFSSTLPEIWPIEAFMVKENLKVYGEFQNIETRQKIQTEIKNYKKTVDYDSNYICHKHLVCRKLLTISWRFEYNFCLGNQLLYIKLQTLKKKNKCKFFGKFSSGKF